MASTPWDATAEKPREDQRDLLYQSRKWVVDHGRVQARDRMAKALAQRDESGGLLESRMMAANSDKALVFPDSLHTIPMEQRKRIGVFFVLGLDEEGGRAGPIIQKASVHMCQLGFRAKVIAGTHRKTAQENASVIAAELKEILPHVDKAVLLGFSRGSTDIVHFWLGKSRDIPVHDLKKIRLWVNFAGVIRGSLFARWVATGKDPLAWGARGILNAKSRCPRASMLDVASIAYDRWAAPDAKFPAAVKRSIHVINFVVIPDGPDGWPAHDPYNNFLTKKASSSGPVMGPCDGMVESAAAILPHHAGMKQSIIRVRGEHLILSGQYLNGNQVSSQYHQGSRARLDSGGQLMDDFFRAMPKSLLK
ncbi:MAG: hypothetical protein H7A51_04475 [Akkermansiaceae bacterium]|nr:hypothetical protein [Akkermansiaceae bacterium]